MARIWSIRILPVKIDQLDAWLLNALEIFEEVVDKENGGELLNGGALWIFRAMAVRGDHALDGEAQGLKIGQAVRAMLGGHAGDADDVIAHVVESLNRFDRPRKRRHGAPDAVLIGGGVEGGLLLGGHGGKPPLVGCVKGARVGQLEVPAKGQFENGGECCIVVEHHAVSVDGDDGASARRGVGAFGHASLLVRVSMAGLAAESASIRIMPWMSRSWKNDLVRGSGKRQLWRARPCGMMPSRAWTDRRARSAHARDKMSNKKDISASQRSYRARGEAYFLQRESAMEELRRTLPAGGASAPAEWDPRRPEKSAWREGAGALELTPIIIALEWDWSLRWGIVENMGWEDERDGASEEDVASARLAVVAPASCLWRFSTPNEWRTLCAQAAKLAGNRKTAALTRLLQRAKPMLDGLGDPWREDGASQTSLFQQYPPSDSGGFALAALARLNPGSLALEPAADAHGVPAAARRAAELRGVADRLIHELGAGWVIQGAPGKEAQHFVHGPWGEDCDVKKEAMVACAAFWEAKQLSQAIPSTSEVAKSKAPRI